MSVPKWTEERQETLVNFVGEETPVTQATVAEAAVALETSTRSISSKLRKMGYEVEAASSVVTKAFSDEESEALRIFVTENSGSFTYAEIATAFEGGKFEAKQVQGKILSLQLTEHVKPTPKPEAVRTYSEAEEKTIVSLVNDGAFLEDIADAVNREVNSVRGKCLSLYREEKISSIPKQRETKSLDKEDPLAGIEDISELTVADIAEQIGKTPRGVKAMLTRRGVSCSDYDGAGKRSKADKAAAA